MKLHKAKPGSGRPSQAEVHQIQSGGTASSSKRAWIAAGLLLAGLLSVFPARAGQVGQAAPKSKTKVELLIARNEVNDPFFHHSVILMLPTMETQLIVGVIINKPTRMTLGKLFPDSPGLQGRTDRAYFGGPVDIGTPCIIFRSSKAPENALRLFGDVYLTFDGNLITGAFKGAQLQSRPRMFLGRAQWSPNQLRDEIRRGSWYRLQVAGGLVLSPHPENLWPTLHARAAPSKYIRYDLPARKSRPSAPKSAAM